MTVQTFGKDGALHARAVQVILVYFRLV